MIIPNWHPLFVHFTVALIFLSAVLFVVTYFIKGLLREQWLIVACWSLWFGMGITIISTSQGIMTGAECRRKHIGGEVLCTVD